MNTSIRLSDFIFTVNGYGRYQVIYTSPKTGKQFRTNTSNMPLIDVTKNSDNPKKCNLEELKRICKNN